MPTNETTIPDPFEDFEPNQDDTVNAEDESDANQRFILWYFVVEEETEDFAVGDRITGQFPIRNAREQFGSILDSAGGYSRSSPVVGWVGGKLNTFTFPARLFSRHVNDNTAENKLNDLKKLTERSALLGRAPLVRFFWGSLFQDGFLCFIESVDSDFPYNNMRSDGTIRDVTVNISITKFSRYRYYEERDFTPLEATPAVRVKAGDTYEMIAKRIYGDPLLGVLLRRKNPRFPLEPDYPRGVSDLIKGDKVKVFSRRVLRIEDIKPQCHVLREDNVIAADNRRRFFYMRGKQQTILPNR